MNEDLFNAACRALSELSDTPIGGPWRTTGNLARAMLADLERENETDRLVRAIHLLLDRVNACLDGEGGLTRDEFDLFISVSDWFEREGRALSQRIAEDCWVAASPGAEDVFHVGGRRIQWMRNRITGEHSYVDIDNGTPLNNEEVGELASSVSCGGVAAMPNAGGVA